VLRFYEDLPPRTIARRMGVPVATVKTRLARALAQLRARLDREHGGDGRSWALALLPLAAPGRGLVPWIAGALAVNSLVKLGIPATALAVLVVWIARRGPAEALPTLAAPPASPSVELRAAAAPAEPAPTPAQRESVSVPTPAHDAPAVAESVTELVHGRVVDLTGAPVAGVALDVRGSSGVRFDESGFDSILWNEAELERPPLATSAADGRFSFPASQQRSGAVVVRDRRWETVRSAVTVAGLDLVVVVAPAFRLTGRVQDPDGHPLADAEVRLGLPSALLAGTGVDLDHTRSGDWGTTSDAEGRFALEHLPSVPGGRLRVKLAGYEVQYLSRTSWVDDELLVVLQPPAGEWLTGRVEADGRAVSEAWVSLGDASTRSDAQGEFRLSRAGEEDEHELLAVAPGHLPARVQGDANPDGSVRWPAYVRLDLGGEPLSLAGVVVDHEGQPLAGQEVWLADGTVVYHDDFPSVVETVIAASTEVRHGTKTDEQGRFRLGALEERDYHLRVVDPATTLVVEAGPFGAGEEDIRIQQHTDELWPTVRGVVVSRGGTPVAGVQVQVEGELDVVHKPGRPGMGFDTCGSSAKTDADGRFELARVPRSGSHLSVGGAKVVDPEFELTSALDPLGLRVVVDRWVHLEVRGARAGADSFSALDAEGEPVLLKAATGGGYSLSTTQTLAEGRSPVVSVGDHAVTLVLYRGSEELARQALVLRSEGVNTVEF